MRKVCIVIIIGLCNLAAKAQNDLKLAQWYYHDMQYNLAIPYYEKQYETMPNSLEVTEALADCYRLTGQYQKAESMYSAALLIPYYSPSSVFYYAEMLRNNGKYDEAKKQYELYSVYVPEKKERVEELILSCSKAKEWVAHPHNIKLQNEKVLNSLYSEWGIAFTGKGMVFGTDRPAGNNALVDGRTGASFYKLYIAPYTKKTDDAQPSFAKPKLYDKSLNNEYHNASPSITSDEGSIYFARVDYVRVIGKTEAEKYISRSGICTAGKKKTTWQSPSYILQSEDANYSYLHPFISDDGKTLYFSSDKPGGYGSFDIYYCTKNIDNKWSEPVNMGPGINTAEAEGFPFMSGDSVLYFSSKGFMGMGGYDIFKSTKINNQFTKAVNMGVPFNSSVDDISFYLMKDQKRGYFSSDRAGGMGSDDIYSFEKQ